MTDDRRLNLTLGRSVLSALYARAGAEGKSLHDVARAALARGLGVADTTTTNSGAADAPAGNCATDHGAEVTRHDTGD